MLSVVVRSALAKNRGLWLPTQSVVRAMSSAGGATSPYTTLAISHPAKSVTHVELHRPEKLNAMNSAFWREMVDCFNELAADPDCRVVVVSGAGKIFTAGIDLMDMAADILQPQGDDTARISWNLRRKIAMYQETFSVIEKCPKPVVVAVHGACIGGGVDLITACDIRLCTQDAWFQVKEVDIGLAADVGTLQRLPKVIGSRSLVNDLALTARKMYADEAKSSGLAQTQLPVKEDTLGSPVVIHKSQKKLENESLSSSCVLRNGFLLTHRSSSLSLTVTSSDETALGVGACQE